MKLFKKEKPTVTYYALYDLVDFEITCPICKKTISIGVDACDFNDWLDGKPAKEAFPYLGEKEIATITTAVCDKCRKDQDEVRRLMIGQVNIRNKK